MANINKMAGRQHVAHSAAPGCTSALECASRMKWAVAAGDSLCLCVRARTQTSSTPDLPSLPHPYYLSF